jgi:hypothetical protein
MPIDGAMASRLRLQVVLPVAVLGLLGLGVGAFATTRNAPATSDADAIAARIAARHDKPEEPAKPAEPPKKPTAQLSPLQRQLRVHRIVVVVFYAPGDDYDTIQTRETRAGALAVKAGFLALNVTRNSQVAALAAQYDVLDAPATLIFVRGPKVVYRVAGYMDRAAIAQAAANAGV